MADPASPRRPFDRHARCQAIAAGGGARTVERHGAHHMRAIGKAGAVAYAARYGRHNLVSLLRAKGWAPLRPDLAEDLAVGRHLAEAA